jgi:hypothetical protein
VGVGHPGTVVAVQVLFRVIARQANSALVRLGVNWSHRVGDSCTSGSPEELDTATWAVIFLTTGMVLAAVIIYGP